MQTSRVDLEKEEKLSKVAFSSTTAIELSDILTYAELDAFLPPRNIGEDMEER